MEVSNDEKMEKLMVVALSVVMLTMTMILPASAAEIQPRLPLCPNCGRGALVTSKSYGIWYVSENPRCTHKSYGTDRIFARKVITAQKCNTCSAGYSSTSTERRLECHGYN